jgi:4a-hydroxytetrahydrobiopterin dehydratase
VSELAAKHCVPCTGETPKIELDQARKLVEELPGWELRGETLFRRFEFPDFAGALAFVDEVGRVAEAEGHHPDLRLGWGYVEVELTTHAIHGLSENDFILAAKVSKLER